MTRTVIIVLSLLLIGLAIGVRPYDVINLFAFLCGCLLLFIAIGGEDL